MKKRLKELCPSLTYNNKDTGKGLESALTVALK